MSCISAVGPVQYSHWDLNWGEFSKVMLVEAYWSADLSSAETVRLAKVLWVSVVIIFFVSHMPLFLAHLLICRKGVSFTVLFNITLLLTL